MILAIPSPPGVALGIATAAVYGLTALASSWFARQPVRWMLGFAWLLHACTLGWGLADGSPRFGFAPAISVTFWLVLTVYGIESRMYPQLNVRRALALLCAAAVLLALVFPGSPLHVSASPWLPLHLALGISSYGLFGAAVVHAWLMTRAEKQIRLATEPAGGVPLLTMERLTFRFVTAGFVLLSATLLAGLLFSEKLYGMALSSWKLDHKTVFSLLAWITFAVLLVGRARFGWRGRKARRVLYAGSALLLLAYVGSRFVLEVVLGRTT
ncbi:MAG: cytochrome c biogenesis protein CcsA [Gammaproteobacteria bacterium]|nr:cytochrome c biogenesis protein CcsA [Gammaproteobacteria bacterium]MBU1441808.1 cytochrome c biogenesis protein CcsA [Gammaproteobacteria bacterium]MBU2408696.1 cytochrome c biogenesis protein CcsA [Gammaproteobacteria bacterium]